MDTRDADGDGIYCESLPCPCLKPSEDSGGGGNPTPTPAPTPKSSCTRPAGVVFSRAKYSNIRRHYILAVAKGWPRVMVLNRKGADARRDRLLEDIPTRAGFDRDEYPAAVGRGRPNGYQRGLVRGINPIGWMADVAYVPSSENRSHGSSLGAKLRRSATEPSSGMSSTEPVPCCVGVAMPRSLPIISHKSCLVAPSEQM